MTKLRQKYRNISTHCKMNVVPSNGMEVVTDGIKSRNDCSVSQNKTIKQLLLSKNWPLQQLSEKPLRSIEGNFITVIYRQFRLN